jgi:hypothetical protein
MSLDAVFKAFGYQIVETDNFAGDYPNESFLALPGMSKDAAQEIADAINAVHCAHPSAPRFWKVVGDLYILAPGFEP